MEEAEYRIWKSWLLNSQVPSVPTKRKQLGCFSYASRLFLDVLDRLGHLHQTDRSDTDEKPVGAMNGNFGISWKRASEMASNGRVCTTDSPAKNQICRNNRGFCNFEIMSYRGITHRYKQRDFDLSMGRIWPLGWVLCVPSFTTSSCTVLYSTCTICQHDSSTIYKCYKNSPCLCNWYPSGSNLQTIEMAMVRVREKQTTKDFALAVNDVYSSENANVNMLHS